MPTAYPVSGESHFLVWTVIIRPGSCCGISETLHIFYRVTSPFVCGGWDGDHSTHSTPKGYFNSATLRLGFSLGLGVTEHSGNSGSQSSGQSSSLSSSAPLQLPISCWPCTRMLLRTFTWPGSVCLPRLHCTLAGCPPPFPASPEPLRAV